MSDKVILTLREVLDRLRALKAKQAGVDPAEINVRERVHIEKFDGGRADIEAGLQPSEYVIYESGVARVQVIPPKADTKEG
mgnify:CR=1 FL=1